MTLHIRNPHSVLAALESRPQDVLQVFASDSVLRRHDGPLAEGRDAWSKVLELAKAKRVKIVTSGGSGGGGGKGGPQKGGRPQGGGRNERPERPERNEEDSGAGRVGAAEAWIKERSGISPEELFRGARTRAGGKGLWLALDCLTDPQNVGAIFRAASFFGVQGILLTQERSAPLTAAVYDVACGGMEHVSFSTLTSLQHAFEIAKEEGLWILGTSERAKESYRKIQRDRPWLLVLGNEEKGMRRLTEESCDVVCQIPPAGKVNSLNVSVASGILISQLTAAE